MRSDYSRISGYCILESAAEHPKRLSGAAQGVLQFKDGLRRVNTKKARCDLWDYLSHRPEYQHLYRGTYMANYSWGELTIDELEH